MWIQFFLRNNVTVLSLYPLDGTKYSHKEGKRIHFRLVFVLPSLQFLEPDAAASVFQAQWHVRSKILLMEHFQEGVKCHDLEGRVMFQKGP